MRFRPSPAAVLSALILSNVIHPAHADGSPASPLDFRPYVGGALGSTRDWGDYAEPGDTVLRAHRQALAGKVYAGIRSKYVGVEIAYLRIGSTGIAGRTANGDSFDERSAHDAVPISLVGFLPLDERWELNARVGFVVNATYETGGTCVRHSRSGVSRRYRCSETPIALGAGVRYAVGQHWGLRLDVDYFELRDSAATPRSDLGTVTLGIDYRF